MTDYHFPVIHAANAWSEAIASSINNLGRGVDCGPRVGIMTVSKGEQDLDRVMTTVCLRGWRG